jgi:hypothetical protein
MTRDAQGRCGPRVRRLVSDRSARSCLWPGVLLWSLAALCWVAGAGAAGGTTVLKVGQAVGVAGTDMVCAFGGPANQIGLACLHTGSKPASAYSFRIDEADLRVFRSATGGAAQLGVWKEPAAGIAQSRSAAVSNFKSVGQVSVGGYFRAAGGDLSCSVYSFKGVVQVACFKVNAKGTLDGSYAVGLGGSTVQVSRFQGGKGTTVFVGKPVK